MFDTIVKETMFRYLYRLRLGALLVLLMGTGCSLIYDGDVFATGSDAAPDAVPPIDPTLLEVDSVEPAAVFEGQGASDNARAIPIVIRGSNIAPGAHIEITGEGFDLDVVAETSLDGTMAATTIRVPVDEMLAAGSSTPLTITLRQDLDITGSTTLDVLGLGEFTAITGDFATAELAPRYSKITIDEAVTFVGNTPARLVATDTITISGELRADGRDDRQRSAGGFLGGLAAQNGGGANGGTSGLNTSGGGGGANLEKGEDGQGTGNGVGGMPVEAPFLVPLEDSVGHGGGGGGGALLGAGAGGAGGGAIELRADGPITMKANAILSAKGSNGESTGACATGGGGGGGGGGGAVLIRSASQLIVEAGVEISIGGGTGGSAGATGMCKGGDGSPGRLRADFPALEGTLSTTVRGPSWILSSVPTIVDEAQLQAMIAGEVGATYFVTVNSGDATMLTLTSQTVEISFTLTPGLNQVCALVDLDGNQGQPESLNCISIAFLP